MSACSSPGVGAVSPSLPLPVPTTTVQADHQDGAGDPDRIDTAEEAFAVVVAAYPELARHELLTAAPEAWASHGPAIGRGGLVGGQDAWAIASVDPAGLVLSFVTGSGDCPSGCTDHTIEAYLVEPDGTVTLVCDAAPGRPLVIGRRVASEPCGPGAD